MFTQRAVLLGFVAFCFYLITIVNKLPSIYFALTWLTTAILVASFGIALLSLVGVDFGFEIVRSRACASFDAIEGEGPQVRISLSNGGSFNKTGLLLTFFLRDGQNRLRSQHFVIEAVPAGATIEVVLPLSRLARGRYRLESARLTGSDVLGLFRMTRRFAPDADLPLDIIVGPPLLRSQSRDPASGGGSRGGSKRTVQSGQGDELRGTRPYAPGDDLRYVHWKSSARAGELVVKEFEQTGRSTALVMWDGAAQTSWGAGAWQCDEWSLILCASLCYSYLSGATPCDFARLDEHPLLLGARGLANDQLPLGFTDALASGCADRKMGLEAAGNEVHLAGRNYSLVVLVTASLAPDVAQQARFWRARGARVQVVLVDGAALGARGDRRFAARNARNARVPTQSIDNAADGANSMIAVTAASYSALAQTLQREGFEVFRVAPTSNTPHNTPPIALRAALQEVLTARPSNRLQNPKQGAVETEITVDGSDENANAKKSKKRRTLPKIGAKS